MSDSPQGWRGSRLSNSLGLAWKIGFAAAGALLLAFIVVPIIALIVTLSWSEFVAGIQHRSVLPALKLSLTTTAISLGIVVTLGTPLAWMLSRRQGRAIQIVETIVRLPAVLPPAVAGLALLLAFGRMGLLGKHLPHSIVFTTTAVIMAEVFVSAPFYLQSAISAFRGIDDSLLVVGRSLGASRARVFFRIALPLAAPALISGAAMAWARALGEFGATLMFAGSKEGVTQTLTLAVYDTYQTDLAAAQAISVLLVVIAFTLLLVLTLKTGTDLRGRKRL